MISHFILTFYTYILVSIIIIEINKYTHHLTISNISKSLFDINVLNKLYMKRHTTQVIKMISPNDDIRILNYVIFQ